MEDAIAKTNARLQGAGFTVVGQYMPAEDAARWVIIVSHSALDNAVKSVGGLTGFAATLRVGITKEGEDINISYTNPNYWGNAYFRGDYDKVASYYSTVEKGLNEALGSVGEVKGTSFGSEKGETVEDLREYHYMFGMPYFTDSVELEEYDSFEDPTFGGSGFCS